MPCPAAMQPKLWLCGGWRGVSTALRSGIRIGPKSRGTASNRLMPGCAPFCLAAPLIGPPSHADQIRPHRSRRRDPRLNPRAMPGRKSDSRWRGVHEQLHLRSLFRSQISIFPGSFSRRCRWAAADWRAPRTDAAMSAAGRPLYCESQTWALIAIPTRLSASRSPAHIHKDQSFRRRCRSRIGFSFRDLISSQKSIKSS